MGIRSPILPGGGMIPLLTSPSTLTPEQVLAKDPVPNHRSFSDAGPFPEPPGHAVIQGHLDQGFGLLFSDRSHAEQFLGGPLSTAPLGVVSKQKEDGS